MQEGSNGSDGRTRCRRNKVVRKHTQIHTRDVNGWIVLFVCAWMVREDLSSLPFTTMCIRESLRLHSPVQAVTRRYTQDMKLPGECTVPKGEKSFICTRIKLSFATVWLCWIWWPRLEIDFMKISSLYDQLFVRRASKISPACMSIFRSNSVDRWNIQEKLKEHSLLLMIPKVPSVWSVFMEPITTLLFGQTHM